MFRYEYFVCFSSKIDAEIFTAVIDRRDSDREKSNMLLLLVMVSPGPELLERGCVGVWVCGCVGVWVCGCVTEMWQKKSGRTANGVGKETYMKNELI